MEPVSLLIGIISGGCIASVIWVIANVIIGSKGKTEHNERNSIISSIGARIAETDSLLISFSAGVTSKEQLKGQIIRNIESIQSLFKPNLHLFDVFYTKYIDTLITRYTEYLKNVSIVVQQPAETIDHFAEAAAVAIEQPVIVKEKIVAVSPIPEIIEKVITEKNESTESPVEIEPVVEEEKEVSEILLSSNIEPAKVVFDSLDVESSIDPVAIEPVAIDQVAIEPITIEPVATEHFEVRPVEDADIPEAQPEVQDVTSIEELQREESAEIASASMPQEQEAEISFEAMAQDVMTVEDDMEGTKNGFPRVMSHNIETQAQHIHGLVAPNSDEEEFSMETIMDLDMSKIPAFNAEKSNITIKAPSSKPSDIDHQSQDTRKIYPQPTSGASGSIRTPGIFANKQPADLDLKTTPVSGAPVTNHLESSQTEPIIFENHNHQSAEKDNYGITGDDVADQIDSFFGFGK